VRRRLRSRWRCVPPIPAGIYRLFRRKFPVASVSWSDFAPFVLPEKKKQKLSEIQADVQESESLVKPTELNPPSAETFLALEISVYQ
jgi:hypothetical protein